MTVILVYISAKANRRQSLSLRMKLQDVKVCLQARSYLCLKV
jgi:hypothetical protein